MVKFSKQLELQLVPEWKSAFCNYWQLKKDLKKIKLQPLPLEERHCASRPESNTAFVPLNILTRGKNNQWSHEEVIKVHRRESSNSQQEIYETELLEPIAEGEYEKAFFANLDAELNKVNQFYSGKEQEYLQRAELITKHLNNLIDMHKIFYETKSNSSTSFWASLFGRTSVSEEMYSGDSEGSSNYSTQFRRAMEVDMMKNISIQLAGMARSMIPDDEEQNIGSQEYYCPKSDGDYSIGAGAKQYSMKFNIPKTTPVMAISALTQLLRDDVFNSTRKSTGDRKEDASITKRKLQYAKRMIRVAFAEFYRGLGLLESFSSLNLLAFAKIMKKYDKVTGRNASLTYLKVVEKANFSSSDKVVAMMDEVERLFTQHFAKDDHKKAMMLLRPMQKSASHAVTFFLGVFTGCSLAFLAAFIAVLHVDGLHTKSKNSSPDVYMALAYPIFSVLFLILLHMYMYGWNVHMWRQVRINYAFIFEYAPQTELRSREVFLVCTGLTTMVAGAMLAHLAEYLRGNDGSLTPDVIPLFTVIGLLLLLFCPLNICYQSSRHFFLRCIRHIILSPLYKVVMADFFLADQLTSQIAAFRNAQYVMCYYFGGHFRRHDTIACSGHHFHYLAYLISFLPYWWRLMQCLRRWIDERDRAHLANGGKYLSAMVAAGARLTFLYNPTSLWLALFVMSSTVATMYQLYWDIVVDWGLVQPNSKNPWLRDQLILKNKSVYLLSIALNVVLRFAWMQSVTHYHFGKVDSRVTDLFFASLEVVRRGHWNFYRLENEHVNNVGKFRAVKTVPLPFRDA